MSDDGVEEFGEEGHEGGGGDHVDGEGVVVLQEVFVATQGQTDEHAVGDAGDHVHGVIPHRDVFEVFGVEAPSFVET